MTFTGMVRAQAERADSLVCVGLDYDSTKVPPQFTGPNAAFEFCKAIIDATADVVCAYKPNSAFFEAEGAAGIEQLHKICQYIRTTHPDVPIILDAKRADIGNTNQGYIRYAFEYLDAQAITVSPYMGSESLQPFLNLEDKGIIVLCRTSNEGSGEFQDLTASGQKLYQVVAQKISHDWNKNSNCLLVVGATYPAELKDVRTIVGEDVWILVPGLGAQGGDTVQTVQAGINSSGEGIIVNSSRAVLYASSGADFAKAARAETIALRDHINKARRD